MWYNMLHGKIGSKDQGFGAHSPHRLNTCKQNYVPKCFMIQFRNVGYLSQLGIGYCFHSHRHVKPHAYLTWRRSGSLTCTNIIENTLDGSLKMTLF